MTTRLSCCTANTNVPVIEARQIVDRLKARGVPVRFTLFVYDGHGLRQTAKCVHTRAGSCACSTIGARHFPATTSITPAVATFRPRFGCSSKR